MCMILNMGKSLTLIAAVAKNRAIGLRGRMPWRLPDELQNFKRVTLGKPVVMGRKTWEAIGRPLPGRQNIVISRNRAYRAKGCVLAISLDAALSVADGAELMIIGGGELYRLALPGAQRMLLTIVDCEPEADTWFPAWSESAWQLASSELHPVDDRHAFSFDTQEWVRASTPSR